MNTAEALSAAASLIDRVGLWQGDDDGVGTCAANALYEVLGKDVVAARPARDSLARFLGLSDSCVAIFRWNDAPGRTKDEVVAAFRGAAVVAEAEDIMAGAEAQRVAVFEVTR